MKGMGLLDGCRNGAAAQDDVAAIDYNGLAGGDGSLRLVKSQQHLPVFAARKGRCLVFLTVAVLGAHANAAGIQLGLHARVRRAPDPLIGREGSGG